MNEITGRCHDCTAPQTETNMLCRHILELQKDKGELIDKCRGLEDKLANADYQLEGRDLEIKELKEQIEKMKACYNCDNNKEEHTPEDNARCKRCKGFSEWELED